MRIERISWHDVPLYWPAIKDWIAKALEHGAGYWPEDIRASLLSREMILWLIRDKDDNIVACTVTRFCEQPRVRFLELFLIGGIGIENWLHLCHEMREWAGMELRGHGRFGWKKIAKQLGFEPMCVIYRMP